MEEEKYFEEEEVKVSECKMCSETVETNTESLRKHFIDQKTMKHFNFIFKKLIDLENENKLLRNQIKEIKLNLDDLNHE